MSGEAVTLPPLSEDAIARMERAVFDEIDEVQAAPAPVSSASVRASRRRRRWMTGLGVAAAFAGGILIAPPLLSAVSGSGSEASSVAEHDMAVEYEARSAGGGMAPADGAAVDHASGGAVAGASAEAGREIISTAQVTLRVADVSQAADAIADLAGQHGGYVEATDIGFSEDADLQTRPGDPRQPGSGWISIRIPADDLTDVTKALKDHGDVQRSSVSRQDVTSTVVDLEARADAARASVQRLTELMAKSGSVGDLIAAESALSERQAQLESYEQQLKSLDEQVMMSTVSVDLTEQTTATKADPAGFADGLLAGWNGLIASLNALVVALGFVLPWLVIVGAVLLGIWLIRRRRSRPRVARADADRRVESA